jgi:hypothetical protein
MPKQMRCCEVDMQRQCGLPTEAGIDRERAILDAGEPSHLGSPGRADPAIGELRNRNAE